MNGKHEHSAAPRQAGGLSTPAFSFLLPEILPPGNFPAVVLAADDLLAERMYRDLEFQASFRPHAWQGVSLYWLPGWEQSPYRGLQPSLSTRYGRIQACRRIMQADSSAWVMVASLPAFLQAAAAKDFLQESFPLQKGSRLAPETIGLRLARFGYAETESVEDPGTYALRGGILDIFPPSEDHPIRVEFFDEEVESIRVFNPETQRSIRILAEQDAIDIIPCREFPADMEALAAARERMKDWCDRHDIPRSARERLSSLLSQGILTPEMDYLLPFFRVAGSWMTDLIGRQAALVLSEPDTILQTYESWRNRQQELFAASLSKQNPIPEPSSLFASREELLSAPVWSAVVEARELALGDQQPRSERIKLGAQKKSADTAALTRRLSQLRDQGTKAVLVANSQSQLDRLLFLLSQQKIQTIFVKTEADLPKDPSIVSLALGTISESFHLPEKKLAFLSEDDIFGEKTHSAKRKPAPKAGAPAIAMEDLVPGDLVVHALHGIGRYQGLSRVTALQSEGDFALIEYSGGDKLYVPVYRLESLGRYIGAPGSSGALDKLAPALSPKRKSGCAPP
jgi:transcription-repair coupling factor (superfamily II helicase)